MSGFAPARASTLSILPKNRLIGDFFASFYYFIFGCLLLFLFFFAILSRLFCVCHPVPIFFIIFLYYTYDLYFILLRPSEARKRRRTLSVRSFMRRRTKKPPEWRFSEDSCGGWIRTNIHSSRGYSPTIRRPRNGSINSPQVFTLLGIF